MRESAVPPIAPASDDEISLAARKVIAHLKRCPQLWELLSEELDEHRARQLHYKLRVELTGSFGNVVDAEVKLERARRSGGRIPRDAAHR